MKAVILAGGLGTRISEESHAQPKPMIKIGGMPILLHIMKIYDTYRIIMIHLLITHINTLCSNIEHN